MKLYSYNPGSRSAKALCAALKIKQIKHQGKDIDGGYVINWGSSGFERTVFYDELLNHPDAVANAVNKLQAFQLLQGMVAIPEYTTCSLEAAKWLAEGRTVVCRHTLTGHSGNGIEIINGDVDVPIAPLYTKYIFKQSEYRVHVFQGNAFFVQKKVRKNDVPDDKVNWKVRNHQNGFVYAHKDIILTDKLREIAINAVKSLGLDFGAVDIMETKKGNVSVLEVNCAPGLEGTTLDKYVEQFTIFKDKYA